MQDFQTRRELAGMKLRRGKQQARLECGYRERRRVQLESIHEDEDPNCHLSGFEGNDSLRHDFAKLVTIPTRAHASCAIAASEDMGLVITRPRGEVKYVDIGGRPQLTGRPALISKSHLLFLLRQFRHAR
jgi:hypothetical protein